MDCLSCKYLKESNKKPGALNGNLCYCSKIKKYVNTATDGCGDFQKDYSRNSFTKNEMYEDGKNYSNDATPIGTYAVILVVLVIITLILIIFEQI